MYYSLSDPFCHHDFFVERTLSLPRRDSSRRFSRPTRRAPREREDSPRFWLRLFASAARIGNLPVDSELPRSTSTPSRIHDLPILDAGAAKNGSKSAPNSHRRLFRVVHDDHIHGSLARLQAQTRQMLLMTLPYKT